MVPGVLLEIVLVGQHVAAAITDAETGIPVTGHLQGQGVQLVGVLQDGDLPVEVGGGLDPVGHGPVGGQLPVVFHHGTHTGGGDGQGVAGHAGGQGCALAQGGIIIGPQILAGAVEGIVGFELLFVHALQIHDDLDGVGLGGVLDGSGGDGGPALVHAGEQAAGDGDHILVGAGPGDAVVQQILGQDLQLQLMGAAQLHLDGLAVQDGDGLDLGGSAVQEPDVAVGQLVQVSPEGGSLAPEGADGGIGQ